MRRNLRAMAVCMAAAWAVSAGAITLPGIALRGDPPEASAPAPAPAAVDVDALRAHLAQAREAWARIATPEGERTGVPPGTPAEEVQARRFFHQVLIIGYTMQIDALDRLVALKQVRADLVDPRAILPGKPPYPVSDVDRLRHHLQAVALRVDWVETQVRLNDREVGSAHQARRKAEVAERRAVEALERNRDPAATARLHWQRNLAALEARATGVLLQARETMREALAAELKQARASFRDYETVLAQTEGQISFTRKDLDTLLARDAVRRTELEQALAAARRTADTTAAAVARRQTELDARTRAVEAATTALTEPAAPGATPRRAALDREERLARAREALAVTQRELHVEQLRWQTTLEEVEVLRQLVSARELQRTFWELRFAGMQPGQSAEAQREIEAAVRALRERLREPEDALRQSLQLNLDHVAITQDRLAEAGPAEALSLREALVTLRDRVQTDLMAIGELSQLRLLADRWVEDFERNAADRSASTRLTVVAQEAREAATAAWTYELTTVDDTAVVDGQAIPIKRPITVGKVIVALLVLVLGFMVARRFARLAVAHVHGRFGIPLQTLKTTSNWLLSALFVVLAVISLSIVRIPITVFAFLGGAIAIGVGFGMQNLLKNLMSGLMLLAERPFKLGDFVEVGGMRGTVTDIGLRASTVRSADGIETLVPNATFVEQNVTNWTYTSGTVRFAVKVGVAYGSPVRQVHDLLMEIVQRHGKVLGDPAPEVVFEDFGADALQFALYFWLDLDAGTVGRIVCSDLRFMIDKAFADAGLVIAYPQRDVHLDTARPLDVRILPSA